MPERPALARDVSTRHHTPDVRVLNAVLQILDSPWPAAEEALRCLSVFGFLRQSVAGWPYLALKCWNYRHAVRHAYLGACGIDSVSAFDSLV